MQVWLSSAESLGLKSAVPIFRIWGYAQHRMGPTKANSMFLPAETISSPLIFWLCRDSKHKDVARISTDGLSCSLGICPGLPWSQLSHQLRYAFISKLHGFFKLCWSHEMRKEMALRRKKGTLLTHLIKTTIDCKMKIQPVVGSPAACPVALCWAQTPDPFETAYRNWHERIVGKRRGYSMMSNPNWCWSTTSIIFWESQPARHNAYL